jgi:hypothetical protein
MLDAMTDAWSSEDKRGTNPATDHNCGCDHLGASRRDSNHLIVVAARQVAVAMTHDLSTPELKCISWPEQKYISGDFSGHLRRGNGHGLH